MNCRLLEASKGMSCMIIECHLLERHAPVHTLGRSMPSHAENTTCTQIFESPCVQERTFFLADE